MDAETVRIRGTRAERRAYYTLAREAKFGDIERRQIMGAAYLERHEDEHTSDIGITTGIGKIDLRDRPDFIATVAELEAMKRERDGQPIPSKGSLDFLIDNSAFDNTSATVRLATSPAILCPVIRYLGMMPILFCIGLTRASANDLLPSTSHMYHLDPEDISQVKVFIPLTDVDPDRAFYALPAGLSDIVVERLKYAGGRLTDEAVAEIVGPDAAISGAGPAGIATACDTNRCLHFGGRPGKRVREVIAISYSLPTSTWFPVSGASRVLLKRLRPIPGDEEWNALIGSELR